MGMGWGSTRSEVRAWLARAVQEWNRETSFPRTTLSPNSKACLGPCTMAECMLASAHRQGNGANTS